MMQVLAAFNECTHVLFTVPDPDIFGEAQPNGFSVHTVRKEELKLNFQTIERMEAAAVETTTNTHGHNVMHDRTDFNKSEIKKAAAVETTTNTHGHNVMHDRTDFNKSEIKMGVAAAKKSTKRKSLSKRSKSSNSGSNKHSKERTDD